MAITFFGVASTPSDNGAQAGPGPVAVTPPSSMQEGDLVVVYAVCRQTIDGEYPHNFNDSNSATEHGGQRWNGGPSWEGTTDISGRVFWCRFNGTWAANPSWRLSDQTIALSVIMLVFRPSSTSKHWVLNIGPNSGTFVAGTTPFTKTITGITTTQKFSSDSHVAIAGWFSKDDNTWGSLSGTGWSKTSLAAQYRNTTGQDISATFAYQIQSSSGATNNVSQNQATLGGDAGSTSIGAWTEVDHFSESGSSGSGSVVQSDVGWIENGDDTGAGTEINAVLTSTVTSGNTVIGYAHWEDETPGSVYLVSITDDKSNAYFPIRIENHITYGQIGVLFYRPNITNAPKTITVKVSSAQTFSFGIVAAEFNGAWFLEDTAGINHKAQDAFNPETITTYPSLTPADDGRLFVLGVHLPGSGDASDFFTAQGSYTEIVEHTRAHASDNNFALHSFKQGTAAAYSSQVQMDLGDQAICLVGTFKAPEAAATSWRFPLLGVG